MRISRAAVFLFPLLLLAAACGSRIAVRPAVGNGAGAAVSPGAAQLAGGDVPDAAFVRQQLAERDREIERLRTELQEAHTHETEMRASLQAATGGGTGASARSHAGGPDRGIAPRGIAPQGIASATGGTAGGESDVVVAALQAALSQEQERRQVVETQLNRLKEETSATLGGPRVPEADFLAVKQELVTLQQALADERAARERLMAETQQPHGGGAPEPAPQADARPEAADLRARLQTLQAQKDAIEESLNRNLAASQQRVAAMEQELEAARATATPVKPEATGAPAPASAENTHLRAQLDAEHRRTEDLTAKLKAAIRINDLIFKIQAQQAKAPPAPTKRRRR